MTSVPIADGDPWRWGRAQRAGLSFDVRVAGPDDGVPVLLLHGFPQTSLSWTRTAQLLTAPGGDRDGGGASPLLVLAPDQRGYSPGARPHDVAAYAVEELVADALAVLDAWGHDRAHVVGHDWGASVAWALAGRHPERVRSLVAVSIPHPAAYGAALAADPDQRARSAYLSDFRRPAPEPEQALLADDAAGLRRIWGDVVPAEELEHDLAVLRAGALEGGLNWYRAMRRDIAETAPAEAPTTFVWGALDDFAGVAGARACEEQVRGDYRFVALDGVGHWVPHQAPDVLAREIRARTDTSSG